MSCQWRHKYIDNDLLVIQNVYDRVVLTHVKCLPVNNSILQNCNLNLAIYAAWEYHYNCFRSQFKSIIIKIFRIFTQNIRHFLLFLTIIVTSDNYPCLNSLPFRLPARKSFTPTGEICMKIDIVGFATSRHKDILFRIGQEKNPVNTYLPKIFDQFGYWPYHNYLSYHTSHCSYGGFGYSWWMTLPLFSGFVTKITNVFVDRGSIFFFTSVTYVSIVAALPLLPWWIDSQVLQLSSVANSVIFSRNCIYIYIYYNVCLLNNYWLSHRMDIF